MKKLFGLVLLIFAMVCGIAAVDASADDLEKGLLRELRESRAVIVQAAGKLRKGESLAQETARLKSIVDEIRASHLLMQERFGQQAEKASSLGTKAVERQNAVAAQYGKAVDAFLVLLDALPPDGAVTQATLDDLLALIDKIIPPKKRPLLGALPYKNLNYPPREPAADPSIVPAYRGGNRTVTPDDTKSTPEAPVSKEIAELAESLSWNPVLIYEWVKNNVATEWYWGSMKGAEETLRQKSGNDADQASLLIALLRASGFPARYVRGTIEFFPDIDKVKNLTGIDDPMRIAVFFQKAGIPFKPVIAGGKIANFQVEHIWVESEIPYSNYRGAVIDDFGKTWLGLDTSIKPPGLARNAPLDIPGFSIDALRDDYLQSVQAATPVEFIRAKAEEYLSQNMPGKSYQELLSTNAIIPDVLKILPASLQFRQIAITGEYTGLPAELRHQVRFTATANSELFTITLDAMRLSNQRVTLSYEPETVEDQQIIDSYGGLDNTPSYLVRLRPVLKLNGERLVVAQDGLPMGSDYTLAVELITPNGTERTSNSHIVGNLAVIGVVGQKVVKPAEVPIEEKNAERLLWEEALNYIDRWNKAEDELAAFLKVAVSRPVPTITVVGGVVDVTYLLDTPYGFEWQGVFIDAALRGVETVGRTGDSGREKAFMRLSALQGSILENRLFEDDFQVESVSTAKLLQLAAINNTPLVTIDRTNVDTILTSIPFDDAVKQDIANAVNQNLVVKIPQTDLAYRDWAGIGYVKENPETGESGWMLSGNIAGGMTALNKQQWANDSLANMMSLPYSVPPNKDPGSVTSLKRVTDYLNGTAGEDLGRPLMVMALDDQKHPVQNVLVTFRAVAGGGTLQGVKKNGVTVTAPGAEVTVKTEYDGVARVKLTLGEHTADSPYYVNDVPNSIMVGQNLVSASTPKGSALLTIDKPMETLGYPGDTVGLVKVAPTQTDNIQGHVNTYSGPVWVKAVDKRGNAVSNKVITFTAGQPQSLWEPPLGIDENARLFENQADCPGIATQTGCDANLYDSIEKHTDSSGVWVGVVLGNTDNTRYPIIASTKKDLNGNETTQQISITFNHDSYPVTGRESGTNRSYLAALGVQHVDENGKRIDAGLVGVPMSTPLETLLFVNEEIDRSKGAFATRQVTSGKVDYSVYAGGGRVSHPTVTATTTGAFATTLTPGGVAGLNRIAAQATATVQLASAETKTLADTTFFRIWGVKPDVTPNQEVYVNKYGYPEADTKLTYTINPAEYTAYSKYLIIYEDNAYMGFIPTEGGYAILSQGGAKFDIRKKYTAQFVLNWQTKQEIKSTQVPLNVTTLCLIPDYDHNRTIDAQDRLRALKKDTFYFWVNDDDGHGDTEGTGTPGTRDPATIGVVNGTRDLVDYFPVQIDISGLTSTFATGTYTYRLKNGDGALSLVLPWLVSAESGKYLTDITTAQTLANAPALPVTAAGLTLDATQLSVITGGKDVILLEAWKSTSNPLVLEISDSTGRLVFTSSLNLSMAGVEQMFRHKNLISAGGGWPSLPGSVAGESDRLDEPSNYPDKECNNKNFVFVHGYNVNGQQARGWQSEMFKRMYWSGSKAKFWGISWYGSDTQIGPITSDYHINVIHAFDTAPYLRDFINTRVKGEITIAAHSLGNMMVSSMLTDNNNLWSTNNSSTNPAVSRINNYFMIDAAVAKEAYDGDEPPDIRYLDTDGRLIECYANCMDHPDWAGYDKNLLAYEWYSLFDSSTDARSKLTWRDRFKERPTGTVYYNFYSSGEEVLGGHKGKPSIDDMGMLKESGKKAWALQEKLKGRQYIDVDIDIMGSGYGGWGFNLVDYAYIDPVVGKTNKPISALMINGTLSKETLRTTPFFSRRAEDSALFDEATGNAYAASVTVRNRLLAQVIPARTLPAGSHPIIALGVNNKDMQEEYKNGWPHNRDSINWRHGDVKDVAYPFVYSLFDTFKVKVD